MILFSILFHFVKAAAHFNRPLSCLSLWCILNLQIQKSQSCLKLMIKLGLMGLSVCLFPCFIQENTIFFSFFLCRSKFSALSPGRRKFCAFLFRWHSFALISLWFLFWLNSFHFFKLLVIFPCYLFLLTFLLSDRKCFHGYNSWGGSFF